MANEQITPPEVQTDDILRVNDPAFTLENVALVTGAASGIGRATALALAANGLTVAATDIDTEGLADTVDRAAELNLDGRIVEISGDLTVDADIETVVNEAATLGTITYLVNIAGAQHISPIEDFSMETYDHLHRIMLRAPLYLTKLCLPHMRDSADGRGCVGNMCSAHGHYVTADKVAYNISKFGLRGLTQSVAAEGDGRIRAFSVSTEYVKTPLVTDQIPDTAAQRGLTPQEVVSEVMLSESRSTEMMDPVEVANLFVFGLSQHGQHLNGGDLRWDGGMTLTY
ncbi:SDR family NAD(P)-dependent oxidoreductase [Natribaculum luteum]|uniref:SDR family NAD(P)-dependent oxidoreductase n=1 Tax=Natribaculum luteum TaxID=1586232 RepID=A0ABD5P1Y8_9EURY|nr:SDR family NAD(P)-dependent oxidoreductase [Natribaculum luteum]